MKKTKIVILSLMLAMSAQGMSAPLGVTLAVRGALCPDAARLLSLLTARGEHPTPAIFKSYAIAGLGSKALLAFLWGVLEVQGGRATLSPRLQKIFDEFLEEYDEDLRKLAKD